MYDRKKAEKTEERNVDTLYNNIIKTTQEEDMSRVRHTCERK